MSDEQNQQADTGTGVDELAMLKQRARLMGINHSNNIGLEALRTKINEKLVETDQTDDTTEALNPLAGDQQGQTPAVKKTPRQQMMDEQLRLVRCRITNLDPAKKDLPGEIFTVGNEVIGTVRKYIPYGEVTDDGYHIPYILYQELQTRRFQHIRSVKDPRTGHLRIETNDAKEFAIEVLPQLTEEELAKLANAQKAAGNF